MKKILWMSLVALVSAGVQAAPLRVALLDYTDETSMRSDPLLGGLVAPETLAAKGAFYTGAALVDQQKGFTLIDRRDFIGQVEKLKKADNGVPTPTRPTFIQAAQALRADVVLRGTLLSFSTGKKVINQGGYQTDFSTVSTRVGLEALDPTDGSVLAMSEGAASGNFRQTANVMTTLSEDDVLQLYEKAVTDAVTGLAGKLAKRVAQQAERPKLKLTLTTTADPATVELDGVLVGSTPLVNYEVYKGDHVLTVGKAGCRDVTKRIMLEKDSKIEIPLIRVELSADEWKQVMEKMRINANIGAQPDILIQTLDSK